MSRKPASNSRVLVVTFDQLKKIEAAGLLVRFSFHTGGLYAVHSNVEQCRRLINNV